MSAHEAATRKRGRGNCSSSSSFSPRQQEDVGKVRRRRRDPLGSKQGALLGQLPQLGA